MWQRLSNSGASEGNASSEKTEYGKDLRDNQDSGIIDSGFLSSGGNFQTSSDLDIGEEEEEEKSGGKSRVDRQDIGASFTEKTASGVYSREQMRVDSGLELELTENLSQLSLKSVRLNQLNRDKVQSEPTVELKPVSAKSQRKTDAQPEQRRFAATELYPREPWELYYAQDDEGDTQLHIAIVQGYLEAAFGLIRMAPHPCLLDILNDDCQSPLHLAVLTGQSRIVRRLILAGANPTIRNFRGNTALHLACFSGDVACARALTDPLSPVERNFLANGKRTPALPQNLEQRNYDGEACLHVAAAGDQVDLVQHLLRLGADLEAREGLCGRTALHLALERGCRGVVKFLLQECQPCLDAPTYAGITAYQIAVCLDSQLARELEQLGAQPIDPEPENESDMSDDSEDEDPAYIAAFTRIRQGVGVRA